jgi:hypothetical protein
MRMDQPWSQGRRFLQQFGDSRAIACECCQMLCRASSPDALVMLADVGRVRSHMRNTGVLPESDFPPPVLLVAGARRNPDF